MRSPSPGRTSWTRLNGFLFIFFLFQALLAQFPAHAAPPVEVGPSEFNAEKAGAALEAIAATLPNQTGNVERINLALLEVDKTINQAKSCESEAGEKLRQIDTLLAALGEKATNEPKEIATQRTDTEIDKRRLDIRLAACRLLSLRGSELRGLLNEARQRIFTRNLFFRGPSMAALVRSAEQEGWVWLMAAWESLTKRHGLGKLSPGLIVSGLLLSGLAALLAFRLCARLRILARRLPSEAKYGDQARALSAAGGGWLPLLTLTGTMSAYLHAVFAIEQTSSYLPWLGWTLSSALVLAFLGRGYLLLTKSAEGKRGPLLLMTAGPFYFLATLLGLYLFAVFAPLAPLIQSPALFLGQAVILLLLCLLLLWFTWPRKTHGLFSQTLRFGLCLLLSAIMIAEFAGYRNLSQHVFNALLGTYALLLGYMLAIWLLDEVLGGLVHGEHLWQTRLRERLGISSPKDVRGLIWIIWLLKLLLIVLLAFLLLTIWGLSEMYRSAISSFFVEGITIGESTLMPAHIALGFLAFSLIWIFASWLKGWIDRSWPKNGELPPSLREAVVTLSGYVGYSLAIIIGLSMAGVNFTGLAVVAGALSVGIGFGLQNIVNNFVSGLILLFERPIKRGDWIVVGGTEGYVKKISVRSTIIQTFDRAEAIVPNSDLISGQVINMMFDDVRGRLRLPLGVAYGSDVDLVARLLLQAAHESSEVVTDGSLPMPVARFMAFGASALDFELFCFVKNVDYKLMVRSDLNFAINRLFREHKIEIPFPQRVVHLAPESRDNFHL